MCFLSTRVKSRWDQLYYNTATSTAVQEQSIELNYLRAVSLLASGQGKERRKGIRSGARGTKTVMEISLRIILFRWLNYRKPFPCVNVHRAQGYHLHSQSVHDGRMVCMSCVVMTTNCGWTDGGPQNISLVTHAHFDGTTFCPLLTMVVVWYWLVSTCCFHRLIIIFIECGRPVVFVAALVGGRWCLGVLWHLLLHHHRGSSRIKWSV